jgi:hypothetical protein
MTGPVERRRGIGVTVATLLLLGLLGGAGPARAAGTTYQVNQGAGCSPTGAGGAPFCTIGKAAAAAQPGDTVVVAAGDYRETVELPASGTAAAPITFRTTAHARLLGSADLSGAAWTPAGGTGPAWSLAGYPVAPRKVTVDGAALAAGASSTLGHGEFFYDATVGSPTFRTLYVRLADDTAPTAHHVEAGRYGYAFHGVGRSYVVVDGFTMQDQNNDGVLFSGGSHLAVRNATVVGSGAQGVFFDAVTASSVTTSEVSSSGSQGVLLRGGSQLTVDQVSAHDNGFHGIGIQGSTSSTVQRSTAWRNARPGVRSAAGISVDGDLRPTVGSTASGNVVRQNIAFANQDTGIQLHSGSTTSLVIANLSYGNGDHGFDALTSTGNRLLGNTSAGNFKDGFSIEGNATGTELGGNIAVDNGLTVSPLEFDLYVDAGSTAGFTSDSNLFWNSAAVAPVKYGGTVYATLAAYQAASGKDAHSLSADPGFASPGAGDYRLAAGSPAIDAGTSKPAGYPVVDLDGDPRRDNQLAANSGQGPVAFFDMGAYERQADAVVAAPSKLAMTLPRNPVTAGQPLVVNGTLANATTGAKAAGLTVELWGRPAGKPFTRLRTGTTDAGGRVGFTLHPPVSYRLYLRHPGSAALQAGDGASQVGFVRAAVGARLSKGRIRLGQTVVLGGTVRPNHAGQLVWLQRYLRGSWRNLASARLSRTSGYGFRIRPGARGTLVLRVAKAADTSNASGVSGVVRLTVR